MPRALIALGSNLGDRTSNLLAALSALDAEAGVRLEDASAFIEFAARRVGEAEPGGPYLNGAATVTTTLSAPNLLHVLHRIEHRLGRDRRTQPHGAPRVIDLDLILYDEVEMRTATLTIPHPRLHERAFVLRPAATIAGEWIVPGTGGMSVRALCERLGDREGHGGGA